MLFNVKDLITKVEFLGLDTQPLRDLYKMSSETNFNFKPVTHILSTLQNQLNNPNINKPEVNKIDVKNSQTNFAYKNLMHNYLTPVNISGMKVGK